MHAGDWVMVGLYFAVLFALVWWVVKQGRDTADDYFLAGRNLGWFVIGASIFASNIGSEHLVGLAGSGATSGLAMAHYELHAWCLLVLGWVFVPFYNRSKVFTMPQFLEKRYSPTARWVLSLISLVAYVITKVAVALYAGGIVFRSLLPGLHFMGLDSFWIGCILVLVLTGAYTAAGGLRAVAYTDTLQTIVLVAGSILVTIFGLRALGGWSELTAAVPSNYMDLWRPMVDEAGEPWYFNSDFPWLGMLFCAPIIGLWYWTTDQYIVQRTLGAPSEKVARQGSIWAGFLKLFPVWIFIVPGMIAFALAKTGNVEGLSQMVNEQGEAVGKASQAAFPHMVVHVLPGYVRGIVVAGLLAALMSSLSSVFNACSTLFTMDIYQKMKPEASQHNLVWVGRAAVVAMVVVGIIWIPVIKGSRGLYYYLQGVQGYLAPPIFVVFFLGIFMKRLNAKGCLAALGGGFLMGLFRLAIDTPPKMGYIEGYTEGSLFYYVHNIYFQYYSLLVFIISIILMVAVSYMTTPPPTEKLKGLTYATVSEEQKAESRASWGWKEVAGSGLVLAIIIFIYAYFS